MKKSLLTTLIAIAFTLNITQGQNVIIPDVNFKAALIANSSINTNLDSEIQTTEANVYTGTINVYNMGIVDLTGIEDFTSVTVLICHQNQLTSLNISSNTALVTLNCSSNQLSSLNLTTNTALGMLICYSNQLTSLNLSSNTALTYLTCNSNQITNINLSTNTALNYLECQDNLLTSLNVSTNTSLATLYCYQNQLASLTLPAGTALISLHCGNNLLSNIDISANTALNLFVCNYNQLTSLNLSNNTALYTCNCIFNQLTSLNLSANSALANFSCINNSLTYLNIKNGNNNNLLSFNAINNPNLNCIEVDNTSFMTTNWSSGKDSWASFSANCGVTNITENHKEYASVLSYPNPTTGVMYLSENFNVILTDISGKVILQKQNTNTIDISDQSTGMYFVLLFNGEQQLVQRNKIVKE